MLVMLNGFPRMTLAHSVSELARQKHGLIRFLTELTHLFVTQEAFPSLKAHLS